MMPKTNASTLARRLLCAIVVVVAVALVAGCGGGDDKKKSSDSSSDTTSTQEAQKGSRNADKGGSSPKSKGKSSKSKKKDPVGGSLKPTAGSKPSRKKGIPASASPFVGLSTRRISSAAASGTGKSGGAGVWKLSLGESAYSIYGPKGLISSGRLRAGGGRMVFSPPKARQAAKKGKGKTSGGAFADACAGKRGVYRYTVKGRRISFEKVSENCAARGVLPGGPWTNASKRSG